MDCSAIPRMPYLCLRGACLIFGTMHCFTFILLAWVLLVPCLSGQSAPDAEQQFPTDPRAALESAMPGYDFSTASLKPWHFKASYQLYDSNGSPSTSGTYEYWWASTQVYRSSWTRPGVNHTDWHTADGNHWFLASGEPLGIFEYQLQAAWLSPLPAKADLDREKFRLVPERVSLGQSKVPCVMVVPVMPLTAKIQAIPVGLFPTYCFDAKLPALRASFSFGAFTTGFNKIAVVQGRYLAKEITILEGKRKILTATVDTIGGLSPDDAALTPSADAKAEKKGGRVQLPPGLTVGKLIKKVAPYYPQDAKSAHVSGTVVLNATIGMDGAIHDLRVLEAPWPSLVAAALQAASQWQYRPFLENGEPVEVETTLKVVFQLER